MSKKPHPAKRSRISVALLVFALLFYMVGAMSINGLVNIDYSVISPSSSPSPEPSVTPSPTISTSISKKVKPATPSISKKHKKSKKPVIHTSMSRKP